MTGRRSRRAVAPMEKNATRSPRLVVVRARTRRAGNRCGAARAPAAAESRGIRPRGLDGWPGDADGVDSAHYRFTRSPERQESVHTAPPPRGLADRRPTHPARFHHRARRRLPDAPRGRLRRVLAHVGARPLHGPARGRRARAAPPGQRSCSLGTWSGALRGRADEWTLWWARGVPWAATSDVAGGEDDAGPHRALADRARAGPGAWAALGAAAPGRRRAGPGAGRRSAAKPRPRSRVLGGLRALLRAI